MLASTHVDPVEGGDTQWTEEKTHCNFVLPTSPSVTSFMASYKHPTKNEVALLSLKSTASLIEKHRFSH